MSNSILFDVMILSTAAITMILSSISIPLHWYSVPIIFLAYITITDMVSDNFNRRFSFIYAFSVAIVSYITSRIST